MSRSTPKPQTDPLGTETETYEEIRIVITPEAPHHYRVEMSHPNGDQCEHAVERVIINTAEVHLEDPIWFTDVTLDVGIPIDRPGDTAWVWV